MKVFARTALLIVLSVSPTFAQNTAREEFREFCEAIQGRWVTDVTLVEDLPGLAKAGEKVTAYGDCRLIEDGNAVIAKMYGGNFTTTWLFVYDAGSKQIRTMWVSSGGSVSQSVIQKVAGNWVENGTGSNPDGTKIEFTSTLTISDGGDTHTWTGSTTVGEKKVDEQHDVYRRVGK